MQLVLLSEHQNAQFDEEYHSPEELKSKFDTIEKLLSGDVRKILDVGGGNGKFLDGLLTRFPSAEGTLLDISKDLLARNIPHDRKTLTNGSISDVGVLFKGQKFDVITINWVLHHLVGRTYSACLENMQECLREISKLLAPGGVVVIAENMFDGFAQSNVPSHVIFGITTIRWKPFVRQARRYFNTAGVGVCFQSGPAWRSILNRAGLEVRCMSFGRVWQLTVKRKILFPFLFISGVSHGHFFAVPLGAQLAGGSPDAHVSSTRV